MRPLRFALIALFLATSSFAAADVFPMIFTFTDRAVSGVPLEMSIYVSNCCHEQTPGGRLTLELPPELGLAAGPECTTNGNVSECQLPALWAGNGIVLQLRGTPRAETTRTVTVTATVTPQFPDSNLTNNTVRKDILVMAEPDLAVSLRHELEDPYDDPLVFGGESTNFKIFVSNLGTEASDVHVRIRPHGTEIEALLGHGWDCSAAGPDSADCVQAAPRYGWSDLVVRLKTLGNGAVKARLDVELTSASPDYTTGNDRASLEFDVHRSIVVDSAADSGAGSLREAIETANAECTSGPCQIRFDLPPRADWYTIEPRTPLPAIAADGLILDARTQDGWVNMNPRIALDGHLLESGDGLVFASPCSFEVKGFAIGNFPGNGISANSPQLCQGGRKRISENRVGSDPTGEWPWPNTRGIHAGGKGIVLDNNVVGGNRRSGIVVDGEQIAVQRNIVGGLLPNGASGIYVAPRTLGGRILQNVVADNADMGVAVAREAREVEVRHNSLRRNGGLGIDVGLDGRTSVTPTVLDVVQQGHETVFTLSVREEGVYLLDLYANEGPDGEGEQWIQGFFFSASDGTPFQLRLGGSYRGKWINATSTRNRGVTSEVSDAVLAP